MEIVTRYSRNPILTKDDMPYPVATVHNVVFSCAAVPEEDGTVRLG